MDILRARPGTMEHLMADLRWLDEVPYGSEEGGRAGAPPQRA